MRAIRDLILIACAVISTSCLVYLVVHIEAVKARLSGPGSNAILDRLKR